MDHLTKDTKLPNYDDFPLMDQLTGEVDLEEIQELRDKQMTYAQIVELLQERKAREDEAKAEEYQKAFSLLDKDKDGNITIEQLAAAMRSLGHSTDETMKEMIEDSIREDPFREEKINCEDFIVMMTSKWFFLLSQ